MHFSQPSITFFPLGPLLSILFSQSLNLHLPSLMWESKFHFYTKQYVKFLFEESSLKNAISVICFMILSIFMSFKKFEGHL